MPSPALDAILPESLVTVTGGMKYTDADRESGNVIDLRPGHVTPADRARMREPVTPIKPDPRAFKDVFGHEFPTLDQLDKHPLK
jgi:hypothetical protein